MPDHTVLDLRMMALINVNQAKTASHSAKNSQVQWCSINIIALLRKIFSPFPDSFSEYLKLLTIHHSAFEVPNYFTNRISVNTRIVSPPPAGLPVRAKIVRPAPLPLNGLNAITDGIKDRLKAIYPGTLWCGDGTHAKYQNEVGLFRNTDICCKQHDECPAFIKSGSEFKGLRNTGLFTRSHCDCDMKFYNCLKRTNSLISNKIGYTYFNILRPQCFRKEYPIVGCQKL